jgi:glucose-1-phosphate thymidylyltransferase
VGSHYLLESMRRAGAHTVYMVIHPGKWDIPAYYKSGAMVGMHLAYVVTEYPYGAPFSLKQACPFLSGRTVLFGLPDIFTAPEDVHRRLLEHKTRTRTDLVLGLFPAKEPAKVDMVEFDAKGWIDRIVIKPSTTDLTYAWITAVWGPGFTAFLDHYLDRVEPDVRRQWQAEASGPAPEYYLGHVIQEALKSDLTVDHLIFDHGRYTDIGTPADLVRAMQAMASVTDAAKD